MAEEERGESDHAAERRRQILEAAEKVFASASYWTATTEQIAREVGLSQPAVYRYFPSKKQLFLDTLAWRQQTIVERYAELLREPRTPLERLRVLVRSTVEFAFENPDMGPLRLQAAAASDDPDIREAVLSGLRALLAAHEALFRQAQEAGEVRADLEPIAAANTLAGLSFLFYLMQRLGYEFAATPEAATRLADQYLQTLSR